MKLGAYTACLHDRPLPEALKILGELGLTGAEINAGGFVGTPHLPVDELMTSPGARADYLGQLRRGRDHPHRAQRQRQPAQPAAGRRPGARRGPAPLDRAGRPARGDRVVAMSGLPGSDPAAAYPSWVVNPWDSQYSDVLDYQWDLAVPFWTDVDARARAAGVKVCIEMHPHNIVFNPPTLERLVERTGATNVGAEMDPSHLFWQGIDPVVAVERLGPLVFHAAAKDTLIHDAVTYAGVLDDRHTRVTENPLTIGGRNTLNRWPENPSWEFVHVGRGHDVDFWSRFLAALSHVDPDMAVNIEHEDTSYDQVEGLRLAAETLIVAKDRAGV